MQQLPFKAVVSDLDGTLLNANHVIGDFTIEILNKLEQKGVDIILATGRNHTDVSSILGKIGAERAVMITSNGARVRDLKGNLIYSNSLPEEIVYEVVDFTKHHGRGTEKVFFIARDPKDLVELEDYLRTHFGDKATIVYSAVTCLEVMNKNVSKGDALAHLLENRNYGLKDCIAFGDGQNDVEMLSLAGKGYVMANADPRLKEACPELEEIGFNKDEAVAKHLAELFGIK